MTCFRQRLDLRHLMLTIGVLLPLALLQPPSPVHADEHTDWQLYLGLTAGPHAGHCGGELHARGLNFPPEALVVLGRINGTGTFEEFQRVATQSGWFSEVLTAPYPPNCAPGATITIAARVLDPSGVGFLRAAGETIEARRQLNIRTETASISLSPATGPGCLGDTTTVSGIGYPPGVTADLVWGAAEPFQHNFAVVATVTVDDSGRFEREVDLLFGSCPVVGTQAAFFAILYGHDGPPIEGVPYRASAIFTVGAPTPAPAGNAGLLRQSPPSRSIQLLLLAATVALVTVGYTTSRGPHQ